MLGLCDVRKTLDANGELAKSHQRRWLGMCSCRFSRPRIRGYTCSRAGDNTHVECAIATATGPSSISCRFGNSDGSCYRGSAEATAKEIRRHYYTHAKYD